MQKGLKTLVYKKKKNKKKKTKNKNKIPNRICYPKGKITFTNNYTPSVPYC